MTCTCYEGLVGRCLQYVEQNHSLNIGLYLSSGMLAGMLIFKLVDYYFFKRGKK